MRLHEQRSDPPPSSLQIVPLRHQEDQSQASLLQRSSHRTSSCSSSLCRRSKKPLHISLNHVLCTGRRLLPLPLTLTSAWPSFMNPLMHMDEGLHGGWKLCRTAASLTIQNFCSSVAGPCKQSRSAPRTLCSSGLACLGSCC